MDQIHYFDEGAVDADGIMTAKEERFFSRYLKQLGAIVVAGSLLAILFVALVDPYRLFRWVDIQGFNRIKPLPEQYRAQIKLAQATALRPNALLLGNSRIEVGMDPASATLRTHGYSAYNLALAGTSLTVAQNMFEQVRKETAPPAVAIVGVDFLDFLVSPSATMAARPKTEGWLHAWQWRFETLFSIKSLSDAWRTLRLQKASDPSTMTARGQTPLDDYKKNARREGYHLIFQQRAQENAKNLVRKPHNLYGANGSSDSIDRLHAMLETMAEDGTEVHLLIYPYHAQLMAMLDETGLQPVMEEWKKLLVLQIGTVQQQHPKANIRLWDFSGFGPVQCELIPAPGDRRSTTQFYWEAGHFKSSVGDLIQQRILGGAGTFGTLLTATNLEANQRRIADERARCAVANPMVFASVRSLIGAARNQAH